MATGKLVSSDVDLHRAGNIATHVLQCLPCLKTCLCVNVFANYVEMICM